MYLIEIEAGREELFQSTESLASAIRRGYVGPESRIYHRASSSWVSITVHPEYRRAATDPAAEPLTPLARKRWTFYGVEPQAREVDAPAESVGQASGPPPAATADTNEGGGLRGILGRAFRVLSRSPTRSELADT